MSASIDAKQTPYSVVTRLAQVVGLLASVLSIFVIHFTAKQYHTDARAWVIAESPTFKRLDVGPGTDPSKQTVDVRFRFRNVGKTLATEVGARVIALRAQTISDQYIRHVLEGTEMPKATPELQPMLTGFGPPTTIDARRTWPHFIPITIAPNAETLSTFDAAALERTLAAEPTSESTYSFILGRADYYDSFGVSHWITFCYVYVELEQLEYCTAGNAEDRNSEPGIFSDEF